MKGLIIKSPHIELILEGKKKWEIRGSRTNIRGKIALIKSGSKKVYGEVELIECIELDLETYNEYHKKLYGTRSEKLPYKRTYAWIVRNPIVYDRPISYVHPKGAIIWVNLDKN